MKASDQVKRAALNKTVNYLLEDPERNITKIMDMLDKVAPTDLFPSQRIAFRNAIERKNNWYELLMRVLDLNPAVRNDLIRMFLVDANLMAWPEQEANREKYQCNIPWALLMDPTSACNLHCTGCWAAEYGSKQNLTWTRWTPSSGRPRSWERTCSSTRAASRSYASATSSRCANSIPTAPSSRSPTRPSSTRTSARTCCA